MNIGDIVKKAKTAYEIADRWLDSIEADQIARVWLIGSRAEGTAGPESDIDFLIVGNSFDAAEDERIAQAEEGHFEKGLFKVLNTTIPTSERPGHIDIVFSSKGPRPDQAAVLLYDANKGWM